MAPTFSIVTPSFRQLDWLKLCAASIADQREVSLEHIVQDAGSGGDFPAWAASWPAEAARLREPAGAETYAFDFVSEKDAGMYDAVNRGLRRARGEIVAYLNCDEQYLPGTLHAVRHYFAEHPSVEIVFAHVVVTDARGAFVSYRKAVVPSKIHTLVSENLSIFTCATFFRRRLLEKGDLFFNPKLKDVGDAEWVMRLLDRRVPMGIMPRFTSTFAETGENRNLAPTALREKAEMLASAPAWARAIRPAVIAGYRFRKFLNGAYRQAPFDYAIYREASPRDRVTFRVENPSFRWR